MNLAVMSDCRWVEEVGMELGARTEAEAGPGAGEGTEGARQKEAGSGPGPDKKGRP